MAQVGDPLVKGFELRIMFIESKVFQIMSQNDVLITQVESMEKVIINKEEKIEILQVHAKKQDDNMEGLKLIFKNILEESENLAFSLSLVEQRGEDVAAKNRFGSSLSESSLPPHNLIGGKCCRKLPELRQG